MITSLMNGNHGKRFGLLALALVATGVTAQANEDDKLTGAISAPDEPSRNHVSAAFRAGFNVKATFKNLGGFPEWIARDPARPQDRTYADGYVRKDASGNNHAPPPYDHATWFWAYAEEAAQISPLPGSVLMHADSSAPIASTEGELNDPLPGFEITYDRQLGKLGAARWGLEAAFGYLNFNVRDQSPHPAAIGRRTDQFDFPPLAGDP